MKKMNKTVKLQHPKEKNKTREIRTGGFSLGGLIFGPLMYLGWGMWKKGCVIVCVLALVNRYSGYIIFNGWTGNKSIYTWQLGLALFGVHNQQRQL